MIRFVDSKNSERDYLSACKFDKVYGSINAFLYKSHSTDKQAMFWNIYDSNDILCGNLSFTNNTFTLCTENDNSIEEVAQFVDFWENFSSISCNLCNVKNLDRFINTPSKITFGEVLYFNCTSDADDISVDICKDIELYDVFSLFKENFPEKISDLDFFTFNYDMNYRLRHGESFLYGIKCDGILVSALEVMCKFDNSVLLGCLATKKEYRNRGFASSLLKFATTQFSGSNVYIFADNEELSKFYKKLGFKKHSEWAELNHV